MPMEIVTLAITMIVIAAMPNNRFGTFLSWAIVLANVLCILAGAILEATVFRLARFDEIDFYNQSLGAVLAGLVAMVGAYFAVT